ncbi:SGNH/GDSL hydrolase family protein [Paenibacillus tyrfis]|uniref:SGNH/GDSL hydrolase family protein n=1 Tax=Paenibacillus tyrfis TaxID=1501230 RepID=UPI00209DBC4D|nr:SGNH/GDSL hydrolase family protein [Paenibacillus tyrfis]MCP1306473.1 SGNH/GDSL hydrolase family protein [Paenibacillus tyrfis]
MLRINKKGCYVYDAYGKLIAPGEMYETFDPEDPESKPRSVPARSIQAVATRGSHLCNGVYPTKADDPVVKEQTSKTYHEFTEDRPEIAVIFGNFYDQDVPVPNKISVSAAIEYPIGSTKRIPVYTSSGSRTFILDPGAKQLSDLVSVNGKKGTGFYMYTCVKVAEGEKFPRGLVAYNSRGEGLKNADIVDSGAPDTHGQFVYHPIAIVGPSDAPGNIIVADSIGQGAGDNPQDRGFIAAGLGADFPWIRVAKGGESSYDFRANGKAMFRVGLLKYGRRAFVHYGTNDLMGKSFDQFKADISATWQLLRDFGIEEIYQFTIPPRTTSTDNWATHENQTPVNAKFAKGADRDQANAWLLSNPAPGLLTGTIDTASAVQHPKDGNKWDVGTTKDGTHPNEVGHERMRLKFTDYLKKFK